jgi:nucleotide-binding universal stress UspA family protein
MTHILVGVDGSERSKKAAHFAVDLARQTGAKVTVLMVLEAPDVLPIAPFDAFVVTHNPKPGEVLERARKALDEFAGALPSGQVDRLVDIGHPADCILRQASEIGADHIVVGARGLSAGTRWLLGSVSDRVVHHARCPVTVVR